MGVQYKRVYVIKQSWTGEHGSVNVWWSYDSQNPTMRQKRDPNKLSSISTKKKRVRKCWGRVRKRGETRNRSHHQINTGAWLPFLNRVKQRRAKQGSIKTGQWTQKKIKLLVRPHREERERKNKQPQEVAKPCVMWQVFSSNGWSVKLLKSIYWQDFISSICFSFAWWKADDSLHAQRRHRVEYASLLQQISPWLRTNKWANVKNGLNVPTAFRLGLLFKITLKYIS